MDEYIAVVKNFAINYEPVNWMKCDGRHLDIRLYTPLFSLIGTKYGGDGSTYFCLPDFRPDNDSKTEKRDWLPTELVPMICVYGLYPPHQ